MSKENNEIYSKKELKKIFSDINFDIFYEVNIRKIDSNMSCSIF